MLFRIRFPEGRTVVFDVGHGDCSTSTLPTDTAGGMRFDAEWSDGVDLPPRRGRERCTSADGFAIEDARDKGWFGPEQAPDALPADGPVVASV